VENSSEIYWQKLTGKAGRLGLVVWPARLFSWKRATFSVSFRRGWAIPPPSLCAVHYAYSHPGGL